MTNAKANVLFEIAKNKVDKDFSNGSFEYTQEQKKSWHNTYEKVTGKKMESLSDFTKRIKAEKKAASIAKWNEHVASKQIKL